MCLIASKTSKIINSLLFVINKENEGIREIFSFKPFLGVDGYKSHVKLVTLEASHIKFASFNALTDAQTDRHCSDSNMVIILLFKLKPVRPIPPSVMTHALTPVC